MEKETIEFTIKLLELRKLLREVYAEEYQEAEQEGYYGSYAPDEIEMLDKWADRYIRSVGDDLNQVDCQ
jgi:hypothetical protein